MTIEQIKAELSARLAPLGVHLKSETASALSCSAYLRFARNDGKTFIMPKMSRRAYGAAFPKANGFQIGSESVFQVRISDHKAVSCRSASNGAVNIASAENDLNRVVAQVAFIIENAA